MRLYEQVDWMDRNGEPVYSWVLSGPRYGHGPAGWEWIRGVGCRGAFRTKSGCEALCEARRLGLEIESNGTHEAHGVPVSRAAAASVGLAVRA